MFDLTSMLDSAERAFVVDAASESLFPVRRRTGVADFYKILEVELQSQDLLSVAQFRSVKEGYARVSRPAVLRLSSESLLKARPHLSLLAKQVAQWRQTFGEFGVDRALKAFYWEMVASPSLTTSCLEVLFYLDRHRDEIRGLLPRQVKHSESTKLIGREPLLLRLFNLWKNPDGGSWKDFVRHFELTPRPVEFRFYAPICRYEGARLKSFHGVLSAGNFECYDFTENRGTLIVENIDTFFFEASKSVDRLVLWGGGWKVTLLKSLQSRFPRPILYWGDIDKEGYEIYGHLCSHIPDLIPTLMDQNTIAHHLDFSIPKEVFMGPFREIPGLQEEYEMVCREGLLIEQEKVHSRPY